MEVTRASEIPEKYSFQTQAKYEWIDDEKTPFETKVVKKSKSPEFSYRNTHQITITKDINERMLDSHLKISVFGMIEGKREDMATKKKQQQQESARDNQQEDSESNEVQEVTKMPTGIKKQNTSVTE